MMRNHPLKNLKQYTAKGKLYSYYRPSNKRIMAEYGTVEFYLEFERADQYWKNKNSKLPRTDTLGYLIEEYKKSNKFVNLATRTRKDYNGYINYLQPIADVPLVEIDTVFIRRLRDKALEKHYIRYANYVLSVLSAIFSYGVEYGHLQQNYCRNVSRIPRDKTKNEVNRAWSENEVKAMLKHAPKHLRLPIVISLETGLRLGDVLSLRKNDFKNGWLTKFTSKTDFKVECPITKALRKELDDASHNDTVFVCCSSLGRQWTLDGFQSSFQRFKKAMLGNGLIELGLTFHGIRHTIGARLKEAGFNNSEIAIVLGDKTENMGKTYSRDSQNKNLILKAHEALIRKKVAK